MPGLLDLLDELDQEILKLKVEGTSVENLLNMRGITHEMRRMIGHQDSTGKMIKLDRAAVEAEATEAGKKPP